MASDVKFAHGKKANVDAALAAGKLDRDDFIVFSDTDDELGFVSHDGTIKRIKARLDKDIVLNQNVGSLAKGTVIPAGSSLDDIIQLFADGDAEQVDVQDVEKLKKKIKNLQQVIDTPKDDSGKQMTITEYVKDYVDKHKNDNPNIVVNTFKDWLQEPGNTIYPAGTVIVYTDRTTVNGVPVPDIKIANGLSTVKNLPFLNSDSDVERFLTDNGISIDNGTIYATTFEGAMSHKLTIGTFVYDGSEDVVVPVYYGESIKG